MPTVLRLMDANANRAREALRTMEDAARFLLDDAPLSESLKNLRHDLAQALKPLAALEFHRDTVGDVGTRITTASEGARGGAADVALAAGKRLSEALRAMEEYAKVLPQGASVSGALEQLRYRGYTLEQQLQTRLGSGRARQWRLCVLLTQSLCRHSWERVLDEALAAGVDCIQVREKTLESGPLLAHARAVVARARAAGTGASVIINDRPDIAWLCEADGVHIGPQDLSVAQVRQLAGRQLLVGVSTSTLADAQKAKADGADYCGVGPMFPTATKDKPVVGLDYLRQYLGTPGLPPHLAIGGITPANAGGVREAGALGLAVSSSVCASAAPGAVAADLLK